MRGQELQPGVFVQHRDWGVGKLIAFEDGGRQVVVDFHGRPSHRMLKELAMRSLQVLPNNGLAATLWNESETPLSWVKEAPLKLVAATLADLGNSGKPADLRFKLEGQVLHEVKWDTWWKRVQPSIRDSAHFQVGKLGLITLLSQVDDVPVEPARPRAKRAASRSRQRLSRDSSERITAWFRWLMEERTEPPPGRVPPRAIIEALDTWPQQLLERAIERIFSGVEGLLETRRSAPSQFPEGWLEAVARVVNRWAELEAAVPVGLLPSRLVKLAGSLSESSLAAENGNQLAITIASLAQRSGSMRGNLAFALFQLLRDTPARGRALLAALSLQLSPDTRLRFWQEVFRWAVLEAQPERLFPLLDTLLGTRTEEDQGRILERLTLDAAIGVISPRDVLAYLVSRWRASRTPTHYPTLKPILLAVQLFEEEGVEEEFIEQVVRALENILGQTPQASSGVHMPKTLAVARKRWAQAQEQARDSQEAQRKFYESSLAQANQESERLRQQTRDLHGELASHREESRLEIRHDMLLVVGETLQVLGEHHDSREDLIQDIEAGLSLALQAGGAELLGKVGEEVPYAPRLHQAEGEFAVGTLVLIKAPGLLVRDSTLGDRVLLKAKVVPTEGGT